MLLLIRSLQLAVKAEDAEGADVNGIVEASAVDKEADVDDDDDDEDAINIVHESGEECVSQNIPVLCR
jgi:hypothetical protein